MATAPHSRSSSHRVTTASPEALVTRSANSDSRFRCSISPVVTLSFFTIVETSTGTRSIRTDTICEAEAGRGAAAGATRLSLRSSPQSSHAKGDCASLDTVPSALPLRSSPQSSHAKGNSNSCFSRAVASAVALGVPLTVRMPAASGGTLPAAGKDNGDELLLLVDDAVDCGDGGDDVCIVATQKARGSITKSERVSQQRSFRYSVSFVTRVPPALKFTLALHSSALTQSFSYVAVPPRRLTLSPHLSKIK